MGLDAIYDVAAPAKINLFLHVVGRRPDGYHLLKSVFVLIDWCDTLHFERRSDAQLARHDLAAPQPAEDLGLRAARALHAASGTAFGVDISIAKHVPWGAGLGGGSSDAASTLLALNRLWGLNWPLSRLSGLGLRLGADVPFFLGGHNAWVEGIGERLTPVSLPRLWLAVVKPAAAIETHALFGSPLLVRDSRAVIVEGFRASEGESESTGLGRALMAGFGRNDLQGAAEACCPEVAEAAALLQARFGNSRMTGSGSAVFARAGADDVPRVPLPLLDRPGWQVRMCRSLNVHPLSGWAPEQEV